MALTGRLTALAVGAMAMVAAACSNSACLENRGAVPQADFYSSRTGEPIALDSLSISGVGAPADSVLSPAGHSISSVYLPMRANAGSVQWAIAYRWRDLDFPELNDTITIGYEAMPHFISNDCGATFFYRVRSLSHTTHLIDSITIADSLITNVVQADFLIYFRTGDNPDDNPDEP